MSSSPCDVEIGNRRLHRDLRAWRTTKYGAGGRVVALVVRLAVVPLSLQILGTERFGLWQACNSFTNWFGLAELGVGAGLVNMLGRAAGSDDRAAMRRYVSTGMVVLGAAGAVIASTAVALATLPSSLAWLGVTHGSHLMVDGRWFLALAGVLFAATFFVNLVPQVCYGLQEGYLASASAAAGQIAVLGAVSAVALVGGGARSFVLAAAAPSVLMTAATGVYYFGRRRPDIAPRIGSFSLSALRDLVSVGGLAFFMNLGELALIQSANVLIASRLGPASVTSYSVTFSLLLACLSLSNNIVLPLWPAYTEAAARGDATWISRAMRRSSRNAMGAMLVMASGVLVLGRPVIRVWAGRDAVPSWALLGCLCAYFVVWQASVSAGVLANGLGLFRIRSVTLGAAGMGYVVLSWVLLPRIGAIAMPIAGMFLLACEGSVSAWQARRALRRLNERAGGSISA